MIKEFAIGSVSNRHHFKKTTEIESFFNVSQNMFHSLYDYDEYIIDYVRENKKMSGYDGILYMPDEFILDIDGATPEEAQQLTIGLAYLLNDLYIPFQTYFSGTGFHINIPRSAFRWKPSKDLHLFVKAELLAQGIFDFADISVTDKTRLIRIPNTLNQKSRLWKIPITESELNSPINIIQDLAKKPRMKFELRVLECEPVFNALSLPKKDKKGKLNETLTDGSILGHKPDPYNYPCVQSLMSDPSNGERHASALRIAAHLRWRYPEFIVKAIMEEWRLTITNDTSPFTEEEMEGIIKSSYEGHNGKGNNYGCGDPLKDKYCKSTCHLYKAKKSNNILDAKSMEKILAEFYIRDVAPLNLGDMCNQDFPIYPGEVVILQAPPASMKTMFLMNILNYYKKNCYFLEMEMSPKQIWERFIMIEMGWSKDQIKEHYKSFRNGMDAKFSWLNVDYESCYAGELQKRIEQLPVRPEIVVIDHIGLMKSKSNDSNFKNEDISQGLIDIAIKNDIIVFAVSEITKSAFHEGNLDMASAKGSFRLAYNAHKVLSMTPYRSQSTNDNKIKSLHVYSTKNREQETLDARFNVTGVQIAA